MTGLVLLAALALASDLSPADVARCTQAAVELRACRGELSACEEVARRTHEALARLAEEERERARLERRLERARAQRSALAGVAGALAVVVVVGLAL